MSLWFNVIFLMSYSHLLVSLNTKRASVKYVTRIECYLCDELWSLTCKYEHKTCECKICHLYWALFLWWAMVTCLIVWTQNVRVWNMSLELSVICVMSYDHLLVSLNTKRASVKYVTCIECYLFGELWSLTCKYEHKTCECKICHSYWVLFVWWAMVTYL